MSNENEEMTVDDKIKTIQKYITKSETQKELCNHFFNFV